MAKAERYRPQFLIKTPDMNTQVFNPQSNTMTISFVGTELKIDAVTIRDGKNVDSVWLSPYRISDDGSKSQLCEHEEAQFFRILKKDIRGSVSVVADIFVY